MDQHWPWPPLSLTRINPAAPNPNPPSTSRDDRYGGKFYSKSGPVHWNQATQNTDLYDRTSLSSSPPAILVCVNNPDGNQKPSSADAANHPAAANSESAELLKVQLAALDAEPGNFFHGVSALPDDLDCDPPASSSVDHRSSNKVEIRRRRRRHSSSDSNERSRSRIERRSKETKWRTDSAGRKHKKRKRSSRSSDVSDEQTTGSLDRKKSHKKYRKKRRRGESSSKKHDKWSSKGRLPSAQKADSDEGSSPWDLFATSNSRQNKTELRSNTPAVPRISSLSSGVGYLGSEETTSSSEVGQDLAMRSLTELLVSLQERPA